MRNSISFIFLLFFVSCEKDNFFEGDYASYKSDKSLNTDIEFFPSEIYMSSEGKPTLVLQFYTTESYPCINYSIDISTFKENGELIVRFEGVSIGDICFTAIGPASAQIEFPENTEKLVLLNGNKVDAYTVEITTELVKLTKLNHSFTGLRYPEIFRYPENSFEYSCSNNEKQLTLFNSFLDTLKNNLNFTEFHFEGDGRIPYTKNSEEEMAKYFFYENESDFEIAGEKFRHFINENSKKEDYIYIKLISWEGEKYLSWMLYE